MGFTQNITKYLFSVFFVLLALTLSACTDSNNAKKSIDEPVVIANLAVTSTAPADKATGVGTNSKVVAVFNKDVASESVNQASFTLKSVGETDIIGNTVSYNSLTKTATLVPGSDLSNNTGYTATLTTDIENGAGDSLADNVVWTFTTGDVKDEEGPTVSSTNPVDNATGVLSNTRVTVTFDEAIDPETVIAGNFLLTDSADASVAGEINYLNTETVVFTPNTNLASNDPHTFTVKTGIKDISGNALAADHEITFTTSDSAVAGPAPVLLGTAGDFVILTKAGVTNVPTSAITGNVGASPITAASMDTVTCSEVSGIIYGVDNTHPGKDDSACFLGHADAKTLVDKAVFDMGTAYTDAAGRATPDFTELHAGDISGKTLVPGLYKWGTGVLVSTDMTFDGGPNDVWILQVAGDLTVESAAKMTLAGGAEAKNIFWQIGGSSGAIIDTSAHISGILLVEKAITLATGASVKGRLLSQTEVTLQKNVVTQPDL